MFTHHKLDVFQKALAFAIEAEELSASWGKRDAVVDQFRRAAESLVLNIAEAARLHSGPDKARTLDYALGSSLECAACLDKSRCFMVSEALAFDEVCDKVSDKGTARPYRARP